MAWRIIRYIQPDILHFLGSLKSKDFQKRLQNPLQVKYILS